MRSVAEVLTRDALVARLREERAAGRTIAFANGCFDILHVGHVRYLEAAAQEADILVVAINDDDSVKALKGERRPILAAEHRAELVAALRSVDFVVIFPESTVTPLLEALHPDVHCKGHRLHRGHRARARDRQRPTAAALPSSAIPRTIRRAIF
jgi:rfaE bifunctional protein nucleotidyltransferase chain/domain